MERGVNMAEHGNDRQRISRRTALTGTALALGATTAAMVRQAAAQQKVTQALANYQGTPKGPITAKSAPTSNRRTPANLFKARSARKVGANCFPLRVPDWDCGA
jgi:hypothetical protein